MGFTESVRSTVCLFRSRMTPNLSQLEVSLFSVSGVVFNHDFFLCRLLISQSARHLALVIYASPSNAICLLMNLDPDLTYAQSFSRKDFGLERQDKPSVFGLTHFFQPVWETLKKSCGIEVYDVTRAA